MGRSDAAGEVAQVRGSSRRAPFNHLIVDCECQAGDVSCRNGHYIAQARGHVKGAVLVAAPGRHRTVTPERKIEESASGDGYDVTQPWGHLALAEIVPVPGDYCAVIPKSNTLSTVTSCDSHDVAQTRWGPILASSRDRKSTRLNPSQIPLC